MGNQRQFQSKPVTSTPIPQSSLLRRPFTDPIYLQPKTDTESSANYDKDELKKQQWRSAHLLAKLRCMPIEASQQATINPIQAKLTIGQPNDPYEQEADRVAAQVVNQLSAPPSSAIQRMDNLEEEEIQTKPQIQRMDDLEEEEIQTKPLEGAIAPVVQRTDNLEEEEIQTKPSVESIAPSIQRMDNLEEEDLQMIPVHRVAETGGMEASPDLETSIAQARGGGQPVDQSIRAPIEQAMGADFSGVKVHTDAQADQLNRSVQARAFTTGQNVFFRQGEYNPGSREGQELIAHELTHVMQQNGGAVQEDSENQSPQSQLFKNRRVLQRKVETQIQRVLQLDGEVYRDTDYPTLTFRLARTDEYGTNVYNVEGDDSTNSTPELMYEDYEYIDVGTEKTWKPVISRPISEWNKPLNNQLDAIATENKGINCHIVATKMLDAFGRAGLTAEVYEIYTEDKDPSNGTRIRIMESEVNNHYVTVCSGYAYDSRTAGNGELLERLIAHYQEENQDPSKSLLVRSPPSA
jgi:hypothetical protein